MTEVPIAGYIRGHLVEMAAVLYVLDRLCQKESSLELHRFFVRLRGEMEEDPKALRLLLEGLGEEEFEHRIADPLLEEKGRLHLHFSGLKAGEDPNIFAALEWLALEIQGEALMWKTLSLISLHVPSWKRVDFKSREIRTRNQRDRIESVRLEVAGEVLRAD